MAGVRTIRRICRSGKGQLIPSGSAAGDLYIYPNTLVVVKAGGRRVKGVAGMISPRTVLIKLIFTATSRNR
ncbi:hypothetical protein KCP69_00010 [Salmonella enterica subsp. enterica]|nr:hypothetical protein KCP69_00010 [Salmonella enterica subsp. enterica]